MALDTISALVEQLAELPAQDGLFNPYAPWDDPRAAIRRANLTRYLHDMLQRRPAVLLLAEAPGYRGCALSGIPVTSERIMLRGIGKWGLFGAGYEATSGHPQGVAEMTATILWGALEQFAAQPPLIWNALPLHPYQHGHPHSNRTPTVRERRIGIPILARVMALFAPRTVLAVGRTAQQTLDEMGIAYIALRHPAQGGKAAFVQGLREALKAQGEAS